MAWFWLTLIYLLFLTTAQVVNKKALNKLDIDEVVFGASVQVATAVVSLFLVALTGWSFTFNSTSIPIFIGMVVVYFFAVSLYYMGLKKVDLSLTSILDSAGAIFSLILGTLILRENLDVGKVLGVVLIICSGLVLFLKNKGASFNKFSLIIIISSFFYALGAIFDKKLNSFGNPLSYIVLSFGFAGLSILLIHYKRTIKALKGSFRDKSFWTGITTNGLLYAFGFWSLFEAYNKGGEVSRMFPITLSGSVLVPIAGIVILKERNNIPRKIIALLIMVAGLWFLGK